MPIRFSWIQVVWVIGLSWVFMLPSWSQPSPRVVTLAPHLTELAYVSGLESGLVGVVAHSDYPPQANDLPTIGDAFRFDVETIMSLQPDMALAWSDGTPPAVARQLENLGIEVVWVDIQSLDDIATAIEVLGELGPDPEVAMKQAKAYRDTLNQLASHNREGPNGRPWRVFYQIAERPLYTFGGRHVINEVLALCGATNIFGDEDTVALSVDPETVIERAPDWIFVGHAPSMDDRPHTHRWQRPDGSLLPNTRIQSIDPNLLVRSTPRILEGIDTLCTLMSHRSEHLDR